MFNIDGKEMDMDEWRAYTIERLINPRIGDRYSEMYSFWMYIVHIEEFEGKKYIYTAHFNPPCETSAQDAKIIKHDKNGLLRHYCYETIHDKSWLAYHDNKPEHIEGLWEEYRKIGKEIENKYVEEKVKILELIE